LHLLAGFLFWEYCFCGSNEENAMNGIRQKSGRKPIAIRPEPVVLDNYDEISDNAFNKLKEAVEDLNSPDHKRVLVDGIDWPEKCM
jgi:hypothetical protein